MSEPLTVSIKRMNNRVQVKWQGGIPPYQVYRSDSLGSPWVTIDGPTLANAKTFDPVAGQGFFKVLDGVVMPAPAVVLGQSGPVISWQPPEQ